MKKNKKFNTAEIIMVIFCGSGISLMAAQKFIESEYNLLMIAIALNGIGIMAFLYNQGQSKKINK